ncbi:MAG: hypothetical protein KBC44_01170 [Candidatus Pacebacteria bacterium]|nr:hypothetical protein [Candidatus Paceibacterota bacterium]MBP9839573.1 hypothetical protein [Candidatus Paceibacterota bacterium]
MKAKIFFVATVTVVASLVGCFPAKQGQRSVDLFDYSKLVPMHEDTILKYDDFNAELITNPKVEYFLSDSVVLQRKKSYTEAGAVGDGRILLKDASETEMIIIPKYSRGECFKIDSSEARMYVTFKKRGDTEHYLVFGGSNSKKNKGKYVLFTIAGKDSVSYGGLRYKIISGIGSNILYNPEVFRGQDKVLIEDGVAPVKRN